DRLPWPCHRLDKETTGALLCGRNPQYMRSLNSEFASRSITRKYLAVLRGGAKSFPEKEFQVRTLLEINDGNVSVEDGGEGTIKRCWAETNVRVLATSPIVPLTLVELQPITGRRHQLRVHAAHIGGKPSLRLVRCLSYPLTHKKEEQTKTKTERLYLHASYVELSRYRQTGPHRHLRLGITSPLPYNFISLCRLAELPLPEGSIDGGVCVDGVKVGDGAVEELEGVWKG
ncbi:pseudouridine synthase, partial [Irpex rosettiformis]